MANILTMVTIDRDGGSISATYACEEQYCLKTLRFQIDLRCLDHEHEGSCRKFAFAEFREHHKFQWTSKFTNITHDDWFNCSLKVSWAAARQILSELAADAKRLTERERELFNEMVSIAISHGTGHRVPDGDEGP